MRERKGVTMRWVWLILGLIAVIAGVVWTLQGFDILPGSFMSGSLFWAIAGPIVALAGLVLIGAMLFGRRPTAS